MYSDCHINSIEGISYSIGCGKSTITSLATDQIIVLKDGEVAKTGTHKMLLGHNGVYSKLYETQFKRVLDDLNNQAEPVQ